MRAPAEPSPYRWSRFAIPISAYLVITLLLPALNGATASPQFYRHALWVVAGCAVVLAVMSAIGKAQQLLSDARYQRRAAVGAELVVPKQQKYVSGRMI